MLLYIHTYGRPGVQLTLQSIPEKLKENVILVVQEREAEKYSWQEGKHWINKWGVKLWVLPKKIQTLSPTRQWIIDNHDIKKHGDKLVMMDDDLRFDVRRKDKPEKFLKSGAEDMEEMFVDLERLLDPNVYVHVGVLGREGGNRVMGEGDPRLGKRAIRYVENRRMMRLLGYRPSVLRKEKVRFDRLPFQQDFDMTLQLLRKGYPNAVLTDWVQGQPASQAVGGVSSYRTLEKLAANAKTLSILHAPFVKIVKKKAKGEWGERSDVIVYWKKAYESSLKNVTKRRKK